jgi:GMP synthase PP-ATPase subunit
MRRRPALPAALAALVLVVGQLVAFAHQAATRHVECAAHGEQLEAANVAEALHACADDHLVGVDGDNGEHHEDCVVLRALHQSNSVPHAWAAPHVLALESLVIEPAQHANAVIRALYRIAPKTSPPVLV